MPRPALFCPVCRNRIAPLLLCAAAFFSTPADAQQHNQAWSVHAFGLKVGELTVATNETATIYSGEGQFRTTGLAGVLKRIRFNVKGNGTLSQSGLSPRAYDGFINTGKRVSETSLRLRNGALVKTKGPQSPATPIPAGATKGALDPMSMMWLTLRDQTDETLCQIEQTQFDGTRLVRITLKTRKTKGDTITCSGTYDRIGGYSAEEIEELKTSPLSVTYIKSGDKWRAEAVHLTSRHGKAKLLRQE